MCTAANVGLVAKWLTCAYFIEAAIVVCKVGVRVVAFILSIELITMPCWLGRQASFVLLSCIALQGSTATECCLCILPTAVHHVDVMRCSLCMLAAVFAAGLTCRFLSLCAYSQQVWMQDGC